MEVEVKTFLESLGSNLRKADIESLAQKLVSAMPAWITTFQHQLAQVGGNECFLTFHGWSLKYLLSSFRVIGCKPLLNGSYPYCMC